MRKGQELYKKAKKLIPGGTMLLSKRPEMFLPEKWPSYFSKSKGCSIWDLDGNEFIDMSIMGIGTNSLGYGLDEVDDAGILCSLQRLQLGEYDFKYSNISTCYQRACYYV